MMYALAEGQKKLSQDEKGNKTKRDRKIKTLE